MPHTRYSNDEIVRRGQELYDREIRARVEPEQNGRFLVVDVETGEYEIDDTAIDAIDRLQAKCPDAPVYIVRVGYPAAYKLGGRFGTDRS